jgi:hypothetical protein
MIQVKCIVSSTKNFLCFFKHFIFNHTKFWTFHNKPFRFILLSSLTSQKIGNLFFAVDNLPGVYLIGQRKEKDESEWLVTIRPELRIIEEEVFDKAQDILKGRHDSFKITHERQSNKYLFSTLIKCKECGWSFRRTVRQYKNTYVRWVCSGHNGKGADSCPNAVTVDEEELIQARRSIFKRFLVRRKK